MLSKRYTKQIWNNPIGMPSNPIRHQQCRFYLQGLPNLDIITDHKPMLGIFEKYIFEVVNPRLQ